MISRRTRIIALSAILVVAAVVRIVVWTAIRDTPIPELHRWSDSDMNFYNAWARSIAAGDWLTRATMHPYHEWHATIAAHALGKRAVSEVGGRALWNEWLGEKKFYQDPLYPYVLAIVYRMTGNRPAIVFALQTIIGLMNVVLIYLITAKITASGLGPEATGLVAAAIAAIFGPAIFFEFLLLRCTLLTFLGLLSIWTAMVALEKRTGGAFILSGIVIGLAFLLKSTGAGVFAIVLALVIWATRNWRNAAAVAIGFAITLVPLAIRNLAVGAPPLSLAASGTASFVRHNVYAAPGDDELRVAAAVLKDNKGSAMLATLRTYPNAGSIAHHFWMKFLTFWNWFEKPDNGNYYYYRLLVPGASAFRVEYWMIAALAIPGFFIGRSLSPNYLLLVAYVAFGMMTIVAFHHVSRFRVPIAFAMMPFAALTIVGLYHRIAAGDRVRSGIIAFAVVASAWLLLHNLPGMEGIRWQDYESGNQLAAWMAEKRVESRETGQALAIIERQLRTEPDELQSVQPQHSPSSLSFTSARVAGSFARLHAMAADLTASEHHRSRAIVLGHIARQLQLAEQAAQTP